jgi:hypothetical protein
MKLAITGHTKGIGASLKAIFEKHGCSVLGFSKSTGYDIGDADTRKHILDSTFDIDLFVNNAYHPTGQLELLKGLINLWEGQEKYIINISSKIVYIESDYFPEDVKEYKQAKAELKKFTDEYKGSVKIYSILPDLLKTDFPLSSLYFNPRKDGIDTDIVAELVYDIFKNRQHIYVPEIEILIPGKQRGEI